MEFLWRVEDGWVDGSTMEVQDVACPLDPDRRRIPRIDTFFVKLISAKLAPTEDREKGEMVRKICMEAFVIQNNKQKSKQNNNKLHH